MSIENCHSCRPRVLDTRWWNHSKKLLVNVGIVKVGYLHTAQNLVVSGGREPHRLQWGTTTQRGIQWEYDLEV